MTFNNLLLAKNELDAMQLRQTHDQKLLIIVETFKH